MKNKHCLIFCLLNHRWRINLKHRQIRNQTTGFRFLSDSNLKISFLISWSLHRKGFQFFLLPNGSGWCLLVIGWFSHGRLPFQTSFRFFRHQIVGFWSLWTFSANLNCTLLGLLPHPPVSLKHSCYQFILYHSFVLLSDLFFFFFFVCVSFSR